MEGRLRFIASNKESDTVLFQPTAALPILFNTGTDGILRITKDLLTEAIDEGKVETDRIRECEVCNQIFWAGRRDMRGCSTKCAKVLRTRRWREKTTEEQRTAYKVARAQKKNESKHTAEEAETEESKDAPL